MSRSRSEPDAENEATLRPDDYAGAAAGGGEPVQPALGVVGWLRWGWRQLTSMRTALVLLLLLAIAAVPGSLVPQRSADPNGVTQYYTDNPDLAPILDDLSMFDVYTSPWFSAIYILLFVSLIGCVIPRTKHHWKALRAEPPRTPARLSRLDDHRAETVELAPDADPEAVAAEAIALAESQLRRSGYRIARFDGRGRLSVSAERGYARETGNLVFHGALVGVLIAVGVGGGFTYTGQSVIVEGDTFVNTMLDYASFNPGRFVDTDGLAPYALTLDEFEVTYEPAGSNAAGQAGDFSANLTIQNGGDSSQESVRVNHPVDLDGDRVYLMGNGYAPTITVRDAAGDVVFSESVPFLPQDTNMTSLGVIKVPDGLPEQLGMTAFFYPTQFELPSGAFTSAYPALVNPVMTLNVYAGDLGIDDGTPRSVYTLDPSDMTQLAGRGVDEPALELAPGDTAELPDGLGTVTFENEAPDGAADGYEESVKRFVSLSIHRDIGAPWVLAFAVLATLGLLAGLFIPRRRMWVAVTPRDGGVDLEYAGLARGEDPTLSTAVDKLADAHRAALVSRVATAPPASDAPKVD